MIQSAILCNNGLLCPVVPRIAQFRETYRDHLSPVYLELPEEFRKEITFDEFALEVLEELDAPTDEGKEEHHEELT